MLAYIYDLDSSAKYHPIDRSKSCEERYSLARVDTIELLRKCNTERAKARAIVAWASDCDRHHVCPVLCDIALCHPHLVQEWLAKSPLVQS